MKTLEKVHLKNIFDGMNCFCNKKRNCEYCNGYGFVISYNTGIKDKFYWNEKSKKSCGSLERIKPFKLSQKIPKEKIYRIINKINKRQEQLNKLFGE